MIKKHSQLWPVALFFFGAFIGVAQASDDDCNDIITNGTELHQKIILSATAAAPAGAIGKADLEVENEHGVSRSEFEIETKGLLPGGYTVTITNKSGSSSYVLGTISVAAEALKGKHGSKQTCRIKQADRDDNESDDDDDDDDYDDCSDNHTTKNDDESDNDDCGDNHATENEDDFDCKDNSTESENNFKIPEGLALTDLGAISIADSNSIEVLKGSFDNSTNNVPQKIFSARAALTPGIAGPDVSGQAFMYAINMKDKQYGNFFLVAHKAPPNTTLHITVNGNGVGTITSDKTGQVILLRLPWVNLATVESFVAADSTGATVFRVNF